MFDPNCEKDLGLQEWRNPHAFKQPPPMREFQDPLYHPVPPPMFRPMMGPSIRPGQPRPPLPGMAFPPPPYHTRPPPSRPPRPPPPRLPPPGMAFPPPFRARPPPPRMRFPPPPFHSRPPPPGMPFPPPPSLSSPPPNEMPFPLPDLSKPPPPAMIFHNLDQSKQAWPSRSESNSTGIDQTNMVTTEPHLSTENMSVQSKSHQLTKLVEQLSQKKIDQVEGLLRSFQTSVPEEQSQSLKSESVRAERQRIELEGLLRSFQASVTEEQSQPLKSESMRAERQRIENRTKELQKKLDDLKTGSSKLAEPTISVQHPLMEGAKAAHQSFLENKAHLIAEATRLEDMLEEQLKRKEEELNITKKLKLLEQANQKQEMIQEKLEQQRLRQLNEEKLKQTVDEARKRKELLEEELKRKELQLRKQAEDQKQLQLNKKLHELQQATINQEFERKRLEVLQETERHRVDLEQQELETKLLLLQSGNEELSLKMHAGGKDMEGTLKMNSSPVDIYAERKRKTNDGGHTMGDTVSSTEQAKKSKPENLMSDNHGGDGINLQENDPVTGLLIEAIIDELRKGGIQNSEVVLHMLDFIAELPQDCLQILADLPVSSLQSFCGIDPIQLQQMSVAIPELDWLLRNIDLDRLIALLQAVGAGHFHSLASQFSVHRGLLFHVRDMFKLLNV